VSIAKPRLLVVTSMFPRWPDDHEPGFVFELSRRLAADFEVRVLAPHAPCAAEREIMDGVEVIRYRYAPQFCETLAYGGGIVPKLRRQPWKWLLVPALVLAQYLAVRRQLRDWGPAVVHAHWIIPQGVLAASALRGPRRVPLLTTAHGTDVFALNRGWLKRLKRFVFRRSSAITVVSKALRSKAMELGADDGIVRVEPMGVDLHDRFTPDGTQKRNANEILFVGRLAEIKGIRFLFEALPLVLQRKPDARVTIAGFGPDAEALKERVRELGIDAKVDFLGPVPASRVCDLYRRAAVFVAPFVRGKTGEEEGLGLVLVEAVGCGCPILVSDLPGIRDVVGDNQRCLVEPGNVGALAEAIVNVLDAPDAAQANARSLRDSLVGKFDWAAVGRRYSALVRSLLEADASRAKISA
jgi:glycosyltransferase involved in cell wall biosynthesis